MTIEDYHECSRGFQSGNAGGCIKPFECSQGDPFIIVARKSNKGHNLDSQFQAVESAILKAGGIVVDGIKVDMTSAVITDDRRESRSDVKSRDHWLRILAQAAELARAVGATIIAESTDRLIRHREYSTRGAANKLQASESDLADLLNAVGEVPLMTLIDPDATPAQVRSAQTKRGNPGRRISKEAQKALDRAEVLKLRKQGMSQRAIAKKTRVPRATIQRWLAAHKGEAHF